MPGVPGAPVGGPGVEKSPPPGRWPPRLEGRPRAGTMEGVQSRHPQGATVSEPAEAQPVEEHPMWPWVVLAAVTVCVLIVLLNVLVPG